MVGCRQYFESNDLWVVDCSIVFICMFIMLLCILPIYINGIMPSLLTSKIRKFHGPSQILLVSNYLSALNQDFDLSHY